MLPQLRVTLSPVRSEDYFNNSLSLGTVSFQSWGQVSCQGEPQFQDLNTCTARTTYCRQMGHSLMRLPHLVQVTMCPHSSRTQSMTASMQIRHRLSSSSSCSCSRSPSEREQRTGAAGMAAWWSSHLLGDQGRPGMNPVL